MHCLDGLRRGVSSQKCAKCMDSYSGASDDERSRTTNTASLKSGDPENSDNHKKRYRTQATADGHNDTREVEPVAEEDEEPGAEDNKPAEQKPDLELAEFLAKSLNQDKMDVQEAVSLAYRRGATLQINPSGMYYVSGPNKQNGKVAIVLDTNILLHSLNAVKDLLHDIEFNGVELYLIFPYWVIKELNGIKDGFDGKHRYSVVDKTQGSHKYRSRLQYLSRQAHNHYLDNVEWNNGLYAQKWPEQATQKVVDLCLDIIYNDDRILDCAVYLKGMGHVVAMATDDKNLAMKTISRTIKRFDSIDIAEYTAAGLRRRILRHAQRVASSRSFM